MIETRFSTTSRSTPATSTPCWKAPSTADRIPNRNSATANDPAVSAVRVFFRSRLLATRCRYFSVELRPDGFREGPWSTSSRRRRGHGLDEHALFQMQDEARVLCRARIVGHQQHGLSVVPDEAVEQVEDLVGALPEPRKDRAAGDPRSARGRARAP